MPGARLTLDKYNEVADYMSQGMTCVDASKKACVSREGIQLYARRNNLPKLSHHQAPLIELCQPYIETYLAGEITQREIAQKIGATQAGVRQALTRAGIIRPKGLRKTATRKKYDTIFEYVKQHGGYAVHAAKALGLAITPQQMREYAKEIGFDLDFYRMAGRRYGSWLTLPGGWRKVEPCTYYVPAVCLSCGTRYEEVNLQNISSGKSTCCSKCSKGHLGGGKKVRRVSDGEIFSSIRGWCKKLGHIKSYQKLRLLIQGQGSVELDGETYELCEEA